jgi:hypothetical protein
MKLHIKHGQVARAGRESRIGKKMQSIISIKLGEIELSRELTEAEIERLAGKGF